MKRPAAELEARGLEVLAEILSDAAAALRKRLVACHYWNWAADPYSRGAYSYIPTGALELPARLAEPAGNTLYFAGEATALDAQMGTVFGALESGLRAAAEVVRMI